jgi:hypothetical protein
MAILLGVGPAALLLVAAVKTRHEQMGHVSAFAVGLIIMAVGVLLYFLGAWKRQRQSAGRASTLA